MPTRTQGDIEPADRVLAGLELNTPWGEPAEDVTEGDRSPCLQAMPDSPRQLDRICETVAFDALREAPGEARRRAILALRGHGYGETLVQDAALVISELAANAVVHAKSSFSLSMSVCDSTLRIDVADNGPIGGGWAGAAWVARQGHGLGLIDALCTRWGADITAAGKVVWGELGV